MTIDVTRADQIRRLGEAGISQRAIARYAGVARTTVARVLSGVWRPRRDQALAEPGEPLGPMERCPTCGGLVAPPCRACLDRAQPRRPLRAVPDPISLEMDLAGPARQRYDELHRQKVEAGPDTPDGD